MATDSLPKDTPGLSAAAGVSAEPPLSANDWQELDGFAEGKVDRRRHPRAAFRGLQRIAPYAGTFPKSNEFRQVSCHGISSGGFSFYQQEPPLEREFIVALTIGGQVKHFKARHVHAEATYTDDGLKFLVGCAFTGRIEPS